ncbi:MAG: arylsulfatase family protein [Planctomycetaceae bacterium]|nr:arylsulfatase family protein [Planctomycetaceae bacterium]
MLVPGPFHSYQDTNHLDFRSLIRALIFIVLVGANATISLAESVEKPAASRPNVLFIAIDDLNDWIGCLKGHPQAKTPRIDQLASRGTLFSNAHCQAPLCNPSRSSLLTGLRPSTTGIYGLAPGIRDVAALKQTVTLPQHFAKQGYFTSHFGKVFHDGSIPPALRAAEFDVWGIAPGMPLPPRKFVETPSEIKPMDWGVFPTDDREQCDWKIADAAIEQLHSMPQGKPFFLAVGFRLPHVPCFASQKWFDQFPAEQIQLPLVNEQDRDDIPPFAWFLHWKLPEPRLSWLKKAQQWRPLVRAYLASTTFMDSQVGRVLDELDRTGLRENTIVVLWSDHGWHLGEKGITGKNSLWERSTRVPLIFAGPGIKHGSTCSQPVELLDLYPTLIDLCALPPQNGVEGHSLVPQLNDPQKPRIWPAITTHNQNNHTVRSENWRYIRYADGSEELYDHRSDPHEWTNLAQDVKSAPNKAELIRWLPSVNMPPVPKSAQRILTRNGDDWYWEGSRINPLELEK